MFIIFFTLSQIILFDKLFWRCFVQLLEGNAIVQLSTDITVRTIGIQNSCDNAEIDKAQCEEHKRDNVCPERQCKQIHDDREKHCSEEKHCNKKEIFQNSL